MEMEVVKRTHNIKICHVFHFLSSLLVNYNIKLPTIKFKLILFNACMMNMKQQLVSNLGLSNGLNKNVKCYNKKKGGDNLTCKHVS